MIYTAVKVTIKNYEATMNNNIILYRGDKNVEIQFEILESLYRQYRNTGTNVILNLDASFGQLVVRKPDGSYVFSEVTATKEGKVIFTIPGDMIDETAELGSYTFQIRLYDETQESRVTLPPVVGGIEIVEPIASEDTE